MTYDFIYVNKFFPVSVGISQIPLKAGPVAKLMYSGLKLQFV